MLAVGLCDVVFFFKQKTAYEMRISYWSSDVCSSDLLHHRRLEARLGIGGHRLGDDLDAGIEAVLGRERRRDEDRRGGAASRRARLEAGQRAVELRRGHHLFEADRIAEDGARIVLRMAALLPREFGAVLTLCSLTLLTVSVAHTHAMPPPWPFFYL